MFENAVEESDGLRLLVASLYIAILCASFGGLLAPAFFAPIVIVQVLYKTLWLVLFIMPAIMRADPIPIGISVTFALIVLIYPIFLFLAAR